MNKYLRLIRVKQYIKNIFFFLPLIFGGELFNGSLFIKTAAGAFLFSLASSAIYIINDIKDINEDKLHPKKCKRPIASGQINIKSGYFISILLFLVSTTGSFLLNKLFFLLLVFYLLLNFLYSFKFKHLPIIDVALISTGFMIRVLSGAVLSGINPSAYLNIFVYCICKTL